MKVSIADNIRKFRKEGGFTQEQLAEAFGVSIGAVSKWELGVSTPDLEMIMGLADFFEVSVDVLVGYEMQSGTMEAMLQRMRACLREKRLREGTAEAEKALQKYPNHFVIVYESGELYFLLGIEERDQQAAKRAVSLYERALQLLSQNTDPDISEVSIRIRIAQNYLVLGQAQQALGILEQNNPCRVNDSLIGDTYAGTLHEPEKAFPYLERAFSQCITTIVRTINGYANAYEDLGNYEESINACEWLLGFLDSLKRKEDAVSFSDKHGAVMLAACADMAQRKGETDKTAQLLKRAYNLAVRFDESPVYSLKGIRFCEKIEDTATAFDDSGETAREAVEHYLQEHQNNELLQNWKMLSGRG